MVKSVGFGINLMWGVGERKRDQISDLGSGMEVVVSETDLGNIGRGLACTHAEIGLAVEFAKPMACPQGRVY